MKKHIAIQSIFIVFTIFVCLNISAKDGAKENVMVYPVVVDQEDISCLEEAFSQLETVLGYHWEDGMMYVIMDERSTEEKLIESIETAGLSKAYYFKDPFKKKMSADQFKKSE